ncbi:hypothetical protein [uncultured Clostridium sp.]|uniref:hypothetical protein n=1 Tax=uncultured Clostridium sp. TaxID=59620 RepID=UPI00262E66B6|nr:hypothetical protein [uncultured Clostridium sp.]
MKKFSEIYNNIIVFEKKVINIINEENNNPYYLNDADFPYKIENIYKQLIRAYGEESNSFNDELSFENAFLYKFQDSFLTFYNKINTNKSLELEKISKDFYIALNKSTNLSTNESDSTNTNKSTSVPNNQVFNDLLDELQITEADRANMSSKFLNNSEDISFIENNFRIYKQNQMALYRVEITIFIDSFSPLFTKVIKPYYYDDHDDRGARFANGIFVGDVDYKGASNELAIKVLAEEMDDINTKIVEFGVPKKVYDSVSGIYKYLSEYDISY